MSGKSQLLHDNSLNFTFDFIKYLLGSSEMTSKSTLNEIDTVMKLNSAVSKYYKKKLIIPRLFKFAHHEKIIMF